MIDAKAASALLGGPVTAFAYLAKEKEKKEKYEAEGEIDPSAAGAVVAGFWVFFLMIMLLSLLPLVIAVVMAVKCKDKLVNVLLAVLYPLCYIVGRLIFPCAK